MIAVSGRLTSAVPDGNTPPIHYYQLRGILGYLKNIKRVFKKMKKNVSILLIVLFILAISNLTLFAEETKYDFRKTNWGMSKEQVKATEDKKPLDEDNNGFFYQINIDSMDFYCVYQFLEDKLYQGTYLFFGKHTNENDYIYDYENLKETLTKKYGQPKSDKIVWGNDLYKSDKQEWGLAISIGHLAYTASWETLNTEIGLMLSGDNYKINLAILYFSKELKEWAKQIKEKESSKGL